MKVMIKDTKEFPREVELMEILSSISFSSEEEFTEEEEYYLFGIYQILFDRYGVISG